MHARTVLAPVLALLLAPAARADEGSASVEIEAPPGAPAYEDLDKPDVDGVPFECQVGAWRVEGTGAEADSFQPIWQITLEHVASCLAEPQLARACVAVRGQVTDASLPPEAVAAFGSLDAARTVRAQGRAGMVSAKLSDLGVGSARVVQLASSGKATYDGASLGLMLEGCSAPAPATSSVEVKPFLEVGGTGTFLSSSAIDARSPGVFAGAGLRLGPAFARSSLAYASAERKEQRASADVTFALGLRPAWWIEPAAVASFRWGSTTAGDPWLERSWSLGLEATHCQANLWSVASICARAAVLPIGRVWRRGASDPAGLVRVPDEGFGSTRFDFGLMLRREL
jgi:hypothetical protein